MFESPYMLVTGLLTGFAFGFLLQKGQVAKYRAILGQLLLKDFTVFKVMGTAVVVGSVGVYALVAAGAARLDIWPFQVAAVLLGAVLFGVGIAVFGYCPGTGLAGSGEGSRDAMVGVLGMITGAGVFVAAFDLLQPVGLSLGDHGKLTIPEWLGVAPGVVIAALVAAAVVAFWLVERYERRGVRGTSPDTAAEDKARGRGWVPGTAG
jgi:uncharacterized membrane protein YedE/YeeE